MDCAKSVDPKFYFCYDETAASTDVTCCTSDPDNTDSFTVTQSTDALCTDVEGSRKCTPSKETLQARLKNYSDGTVYTTGDTTKDNWLSGITNYCPLMDEATCQNSTSLKATETAGVVEYSGLTEDKNTACYYEIGVMSPCEGKDTTLMNLKFSQKGENAFIIVKTAKSWNS